jgi:hypothetical protein
MGKVLSPRDCREKLRPGPSLIFRVPPSLNLHEITWPRIVQSTRLVQLMAQLRALWRPKYSKVITCADLREELEGYSNHQPGVGRRSAVIQARVAGAGEHDTVTAHQIIPD